MPLCLGASGLVRARQMPQSARSATEFQTFWPVSLQPPSTLVGAGAQRREVGAGAGLGEELAPGQLAEQRRPHEPLALLVGAVLEDRRHRPAGDHDVGPGQLGAGQLLVDDDLGDGVRAEAVRRRPVRRQVAGLDERRAALLRRQRGDPLDGRPDLGADRLVAAVEVEVRPGGVRRRPRRSVSRSAAASLSPTSARRASARRR